MCSRKLTLDGSLLERKNGMISLWGGHRQSQLCDDSWSSGRFAVLVCIRWSDPKYSTTPSFPNTDSVSVEGNWRIIYYKGGASWWVMGWLPGLSARPSSSASPFLLLPVTFCSKTKWFLPPFSSHPPHKIISTASASVKNPKRDTLCFVGGSPEVLMVGCEAVLQESLEIVLGTWWTEGTFGSYLTFVLVGYEPLLVSWLKRLGDLTHDLISPECRA